MQLSLLTLLLHLYSDSLAVYLRYHEKLAIGSTDCRDFPDHPVSGLVRSLIPLMGIGTLPALTALVIYAIFPILQNTITGLKGIDPNLQEADCLWDD